MLIGYLILDEAFYTIEVEINVCKNVQGQINTSQFIIHQNKEALVHSNGDFRRFFGPSQLSEIPLDCSLKWIPNASFGYAGYVPPFSTYPGLSRAQTSPAPFPSKLASNHFASMRIFPLPALPQA